MQRSLNKAAMLRVLQVTKGMSGQDTRKMQESEEYQSSLLLSPHNPTDSVDNKKHTL